MVPDLSFEEAQRRSAEDVRMLTEIIGRPASELGLKRPNQSVITAVHRMLEDEHSLERGEIISRILRLPSPWCNQLLEYVSGVSPYDGKGGLEIEVDLVNTGSNTIFLRIGADEIPDINPQDGTELSTYSVEKRWYNLKPGESLSVEATRAVGMLESHSAMAMKPGQLRQVGKFADRGLREVGFRARYIDQNGPKRERRLIEAPAKKRAKVS